LIQRISIIAVLVLAALAAVAFGIGAFSSPEEKRSTFLTMP
jgi:hypothetical protein